MEISQDDYLKVYRRKLGPNYLNFVDFCREVGDRLVDLGYIPRKTPTRKIRVMDLFSGIGGLSYGFSHDEDFEVVVANEIDPDIAKAYTLNHPSVKMLNCGIERLTAQMLSEAIGGEKIDLVVGGPPCQSYSTIGKRKMDGRANLFMEYKRVLQILSPEAFIFENVTGILSMDKGNLFPRIKAEFEEIGYDLVHKVLDAADYGVPQHRKRVILVGFKGKNGFEYPKPTHGPGLIPYRTLGDALGDLPSLKTGESSSFYLHSPENDLQAYFRKNSVVLTEHKAPRNGKRMVEIMEALGEGQGRYDLPEEIRPKKGFGNAYAKLWWDRPSTTITRNFATPSSSRCIHPRDSRAMTVREGARLQSFPDDYALFGSDGKKKLEIGNSVPPLLSVVLARQMAEAFLARNETGLEVKP